MAVIKFDYEAAMSQVRVLEQAALNCEQVVNDVKKQIIVIETSWTGNAASAMLDKLNSWIAETKKIQNQLNREASVIRKKAEYLKAIDESESSMSGAIAGKGSGGGGSVW